MPEVPKFALDATLAKYVNKPAELIQPECILLYGQPGCGKGLVYGTPVYTPSGPTPVEQLEIGDEVIGSDGKPVRVYGIWDRGVLPVFRVSFSDGASVTVDADHLWTVTTDKGVTSTIPTREVDRKINRAYAKHLDIPIVQPVEFEGGALPIPAYVLGALIADGHLHGASIQWTKNDQNVVDEFNREAEAKGFAAREVTSESSTVRQWKVNHWSDDQTHSLIKTEVTSLGLNVASGDKFIPPLYLDAAIEDRWALVYGLFDGDGRVRTGRGMAQYHTTSERLANDVLQLLWSLGVSAKRSSNRRTDGTWCINVLSHHQVFRASENARRLNPDKRARPTRRIVSVVPDGEALVRCIAVEAEDQLYVTKDFIVTHNTHLAGTAADLPGVKKVLYLDLEGSTVGVLDRLDNGDKIDVIRVDKHETPFQFLQAILAGLFAPGAETEYDVVIIDTFDVAQDLAISYFESIAPTGKSGEKDGFYVWGEVKKWSVDAAKGLKKIKALGIMVVHDTEEKTTGGALTKRLLLAGKAKDVVPGIPDVVAYLERKIVDGTAQTVAYFGTDDNKVTKDRFAFPPKVLGATIPALFDYISKKKNSNEEDK